MKQRSIVILLMFSLFLGLSFSGVSASGVEIARMTKEQLQTQIQDKNIVVVDVRTGRDWKSSEFKIKGAVRPSDSIVDWAKSYSKDTTFVLYCA